RAITPEITRPWLVRRPISPDGRLAVLVDGRSVSLYPVEGGDPRPVPGLLEGERPVRWSGEGRSLYVRRFGEQPIRIFGVDISTGQRQLWKEIANIVPEAGGNFLLTPDGKSYVYTHGTNSSDLYLVEGLK